MNRLANRVLKFAAVAAVCGFATVGNAAEWTYDSSAKTITDGEWSLNASVSSTNVTVAGVVSGTDSFALLDLRKPVDGGAKVIVALGPAAFKGNTTIEEVRLPDTLTSFNTRGDGADAGTFNGCTNLRKVTPFLPNGLTAITFNAFRGCTSLEGDLVLGGEAACSVGQYSYSGHTFYKTKITSVKLGEGVTSLPCCAFANCTALTNVVLSSKFKTFGSQGAGGESGVFLNCSALRTVTPFLPETVTAVPWATFQNCTSLEGDLVLGGTNALTMTQYTSTGHAFYNTKITSVKMGDGLTTLPCCTFAYCTELTNVVLSSRLTTISQQGAGGDSGAFLGCTKLERVTPFLPASLVSLGFKTFYNCTSLKGDLTVGTDTNSVTLNTYGSTGHHFGNTAIESVTLGAAQTSYSVGAFSGCKQLTNIVIHAEAPVFGSELFKNDTAVTDVWFDGYPTWGSSSFGGWSAYQSRFWVPGRNRDWVSFMGDASLLYSWTNVEGTATADLYINKFGNDPLPRGYTVSTPVAKQWIVTQPTDESVYILQVEGAPEDFGEPTPAYGENDVSEAVSSAGGLACSAPQYVGNGDNLMECTSHTLSVYDEAQARWVDSVTEPGNVCVYTKPSSTAVRQLLWNFTVVGHRLSVQHPDWMTVTPSVAPAVDDYYLDGTEVELEVSFGGGAFSRWYGDISEEQAGSSKIKVTVGGAMTLVPYVAQDWTYDSTAKTITDGYWTLNVSVNGSNLTVTGAKVASALPLLDLRKPVDDGSKVIVALGPAAFKGNTTIEEVRLPDTLTSFNTRGDGADAGTFNGCTNLRKVTPFLPNGLTAIAFNAFRNCTSLEGDLVLGGDAACSVGQYSYSGHTFYKTKITSVKLGEGVTSLPCCAFANCTALTNVVLSSGFKTFGSQGAGGESGVFLNCSALRTVTPFLPETVTAVPWATFQNCTSLEGDLVLGGTNALTMTQYTSTGHAFYKTKITSVKMGDGVTSLPCCTFANCKSLTNVVLSSKLMTFGSQGAGGESGVFFNCSALATVTPFLPGTVTAVPWSTFQNCTLLASDLTIGTDTNAPSFSSYNGTTHPFGNTAIPSVTFGAGVTALPANLFNSDKQMREVYFRGWPTTVNGSAFAGFDSYQTRIHAPRTSTEWMGYLANGENVTRWNDLTDAQRESYTNRFVGRAYGLGRVAPYANQWFVKWNPNPGNFRVIFR